MMAEPNTSSATTLLPRTVRRALNAMQTDLGHRWSVNELARGAGVSSRTLQRQFLAFLGKAPLAVLRDIGFEQARRDLLQGRPGTQVMDVALKCGFSHFGRFAVEYRHRYGETPSQTLKRQATLFAAIATMRPSVVPSRDRLTIAFGRIEASPENSEIAADLCDDIAIALTRAGVSVVVPPGSARYQLGGSIRGSGAQMRLVLRLIDHETGRQLWANRIDSPLSDQAAVEDQLATRITAALHPCLRLVEIERALRKPDGELSPHDLALRAMPGVLSLDADGNARALEWLERAMDRNPDHALATALAAWAHVQRVVYHFTSNLQQERARSIELARKARALPGDATVLAVLGNALTLLDDLDAADLVIRKALSIDGGSAWAWSRSGWIDVYRGAPESAIERLKIALDLAPHDSLAFNSMVGIGCANFKAGNYAEAARWQERALIEHPSAAWVHRTLGPAYLLSGSKREAGRSLAALRTRYPDLTLSEVQEGMPPLPESYQNLVFEALSDIGLPA
jgi:AraC-like DNA-binding protein/tetratricopeptide (TPR) repeat protein